MASNALLTAMGAWTLTYLAHSTLLLIAACLLCRTIAVRSHALRERVWKFAAVAGVVTAALAVFGGWGLAVSSLTEPEQTQAAIDLGAARPGTSGQGVQSERPSVDEASDTLASQSGTRAIPNWPDEASESSRLQSSVVSGKAIAAGRAFLPAASVLPLRDASEVADSNSLGPLDQQLDVPITTVTDLPRSFSRLLSQRQVRRQCRIQWLGRAELHIVDTVTRARLLHAL